MIPLVRSGGEAETRVLRTIVGILGVTAAAFLLITLDPIVVLWQYVSPVWSIPAVLVVFIAPMAVAVTAFAMSAVTLRRLLGAYSVLALLATVTVLLAAGPSAAPAGLSPWPLSIAALYTVAAALAFPASYAWGLLAASGVVIVVVRDLATDGSNIGVALQDSITSVAFGAIFSALALVSMRSARALDEAASAARAAAVRRASGMARQRERTRLDALLHDDVMTTLFYASQGDPALDEAVRRQARYALDELARVGEVGGSPVDAGSFTSRIRSVVLQGETPIGVTVIGRRESLIPAEVDDAFAEATAEAVRNSLLHAGPEGIAVARSATIVLDEHRVVVRIEDDGVGFDARDVRPHRLGISVSIRRRMASVPGGSARVQSTPGRGVLVQLQWTPS